MCGKRRLPRGGPVDFLRAGESREGPPPGGVWPDNAVVIETPMGAVVSRVPPDGPRGGGWVGQGHVMSPETSEVYT